MSGPIDTAKLDTCGCCETGPDRPSHENAAGLPELEYRIGTHPTLLARMKARIHAFRSPDGDFEGRRALADLSTRSPDDPAIAMMDAWAVVGDVVTFYQERIANEGFLRTATERRSILDLARAIGYELKPGVSAAAFVAFTVDDAKGAPVAAEVPAGTPILSIPASQDELPQTFETTEDLTARLAWNAMRPRLLHPQSIDANSTEIRLDGAATGLSPGDTALIVSASGAFAPRTVLEVEPDTGAGTTKVTLQEELPVASMYADSLIPGILDPEAEPLEPTADNIRAEVYGKRWTEEDLQAFLTYHEWEEVDVLAWVAVFVAEELAGRGEFHALRESAGFFGNRAPHYLSLPEDLRRVPGDSDDDAADKPFPHNWDTDSGWEIWKDSLKGPDVSYADAHVYLDRKVEGLTAGGYAVFRAKGVEPRTYAVAEMSEGSRVGFGFSAEAVALSLTDAGTTTGPTQESGFLVRKTTAHLRSEKLPLAAYPSRAPIPAGTKSLLLGSMVTGLSAGQALALEGEEPGAEAIVRREIAVLSGITHHRGRTTLVFEEALAFGYRRETLVLNANVVLADHGETVSGEVLGSGEGAAANQSFKLGKHPLTHVSAENARGSKSTLTLRVDKVEWTEEPSLYGLPGTSRSYVVRIDDDAVPSVVFGDGKSGARLPTGQENVKADYRSGIGSEGEVGAGALRLLKKRPFGIREVTNPLDASGAEDPEKLDDARDNAPLTVLTLDRIVSLRDYEDFARAYAGIGKAQAIALWDGQGEQVHITVADADGDEVVEPLKGKLLAAIEGARDPLRPVVLTSFAPRVFFLRASVLVDEAYLWEDVRPGIEEALLDAFGFESRSFGQPVAVSEVIEVVHGIEGVVAVDVDDLSETPVSGAEVGSLFSPLLESSTARYDEDGVLHPAELLLIHPQGIHLSEMTP